MAWLGKGVVVAVIIVMSLWMNITASGAAIAVEGTTPVIWLGTTSGFPRGLCVNDRDPGYVGGFSVKIFADGRVVVWNAVQSYPPPDLTAVSVQGFVELAQREGFFRLPRHMRDTSCREASTTYLQVRAHGKSHTVDIYGFLDGKHPALSYLLQTLYRAARV